MPIEPDDVRRLKGPWRLNWREEAGVSEVFKLVADEAPEHILGLISIGRNQGYVEVKLLENSPPNVGRGKQFRRLAGTLLAFAARLSFRLENGGILMLVAKSRLVEHYGKSYGFEIYQKDRKMMLDTRPAIRLISEYGKEA